jgi:WD40 repeat protein
VKVWEAETGRELLTLHGHRDSVRSLAWSPDGSKLATASADHTAKVWEPKTGRELLTLTGHQDPLYSVAWSPDGSKLATASGDHTAKVWEAKTGRELLTLHGGGYVLSVAWSPDGKRLAAAGEDDSAGAAGITYVYAIGPAELLRLARSRITRSLTSRECKRYLGTEPCPALPVVP